MNIYLNGECRKVEACFSLKCVVDSLEVPEKGLVTLLNDEIIPESERNKKTINENDSIEVISFVSGG